MYNTTRRFSQFTITTGLICCIITGLAACQNTTPQAAQDGAYTQLALDETTLVYPGTIAPELAQRFSELALKCIHQEFPNKISRTTATAEAIGRPKDIFPAFYGCFDWHSSVHGHWLLVRLLWFLQLTAELREWRENTSEPASDPQLQAKVKTWLATLEPLEGDIANGLKSWLPKLAYPIRLGTHNQSAFAFGLMLDWARISGDFAMEALITERATAFHQGDVNCPLAYEPSGEDFLSPCLMEADLIDGFMPEIPTHGTGDWLAPGIVKDASDGKLVHLDGVNSSRAWNLYNIARALPEGDARKSSLVAAAKLHADTGVAAVSDTHYSGSHWLASFATYLMTDRGWTKDGAH